MARNIRKIEALPAQAPKRTRVAAYARVSSGKEAMLESLSAQVSYYNGLIQKRRDWEFAGVFADEAITGTKDSRAGFQDLISDCRAGKIDMIVTKAVTRFARNTLTLLETVRELRSLGVDVFFENENIHTLSGEGELMLSILASYAQEESLAVSEHCKWRIRNAFKDGQTNNGVILGYRLIDGQFAIVPEEAAIVRQIFADYLSGMGFMAIAKRLNEEEDVTRRGFAWRPNSVHVVLQNEKYTGDMLLQKTFTDDHIHKRKRKNAGELPMYFVEGSHEAIVDKETFARVQAELARRTAKYCQRSEAPPSYPFTGMIRCGHCGASYRRKIANASSVYARPVWICTTFNTKGKKACASQQIPEEILLDATAKALGMTTFDEAVFHERIQEIIVPAANRLLFVFRNGYEHEATWEQKSRRESWSDDMCEAARQREMERRCQE